jgi:hypothetical protein
LPEVADVVVANATANQSWLIIRTQVEGFDDLDNVRAIQDKYSLTPLSSTLRILCRVAERFRESFQEGGWNFHAIRAVPGH